MRTFKNSLVYSRTLPLSWVEKAFLVPHSQHSTDRTASWTLSRTHPKYWLSTCFFRCHHIASLLKYHNVDKVEGSVVNLLGVLHTECLKVFLHVTRQTAAEHVAITRLPWSRWHGCPPYLWTPQSKIIMWTSITSKSIYKKSIQNTTQGKIKLTRV